MRLSNKYLSIKHHVKIKTINYCIIQMFLYNIIRIFTLMFSSDLVFGHSLSVFFFSIFKHDFPLSTPELIDETGFIY